MSSIKKEKRMKNKVLVKLMIPEIDENYDLYLPLNKQIGNVIELLNKSLKEITKGAFIPSEERHIYNRDTGEVYDPNVILKDTNIRNSTTIVLL